MNQSVCVLVVDDVREWRRTIRLMLHQLPQVEALEEASDGLEAVEKAQELQPEVVLLDLGLPKLNGIETAKRIRQVSPDSKIIFVTQENDREVKVAALATGAEQYVIKANAASDLQPAVETALRDYPLATRASAASAARADRS